MVDQLHAAEAQAHRYGERARQLLLSTGTQRDVDEQLGAHLEAWYAFARQLHQLGWTEHQVRRVTDAYSNGVA